MPADLRFERLWTRAALVLAGTLILFFIISQFEGLLRLPAWIAAGLARIPDAIGVIMAHYAALTPSMLIIPLIVGAAFGALTTALVVPGRKPRDLAIGALAGAIGGQILTIGLRHCTYAAEAPFGEAIAGGVLTCASALILLAPVWTALRGRVAAAPGIFKAPGLAYALLAPSLAILTIFLYIPTAQMVALSLNLRRFPLPQERFVCLGNYAALASDAIYQTSFITTLAITAAIVAVSLVTALGIAVLASQKVRFIAVYRAFLIWPFALSPVVTGVIFLALFREGTSGILSYALTQMFGDAPSWLRDPNWARAVIVASSVWNILGFNILFYIAGLQNVPKDLLEAAQIDGANVAQRFLRVTVPLLAPYTFFLLITNITYGFYGVYGAVDALTQGGPPLGAGGQFGGATNMLIYKLYEDAFSPGSPVGLAAAQAVVLFALVAGLTLLQFGQVDRKIQYGNQ
ncbi:MAG: sugar ABC transporter permease [Chloroflexota bacterium]|nr:sugar ABC transporter permease [Chloroflexota bacterium]